MAHRVLKAAPLLILGFLVCASAGAQFVPLSRCRGAFPCSIPFAVIYQPDPQIAGQYGNTTSKTPLVVSVPLKIPLAPRLETARQPSIESALDEAIRRSLKTRRPEGEATSIKPATPEEPKPAPDSEPQPQPPR